MNRCARVLFMLVYRIKGCRLWFTDFGIPQCRLSVAEPECAIRQHICRLFFHISLFMRIFAGVNQLKFRNTFRLMSFISDFKEFALKGNIIDMAVGVVIGGAFGKIVTSLVNQIIMPLVGTMTGGINFSTLAYELTPASVDEAGNEIPAVMLGYGVFIQDIVDFLIIALCIFCALRVIMKLQKKKEEAAPAPAGPSAEEKLLTEIRDLLKEKK